MLVCASMLKLVCASMLKLVCASTVPSTSKLKALARLANASELSLRVLTREERSCALILHACLCTRARARNPRKASTRE